MNRTARLTAAFILALGLSGCFTAEDPSTFKCTKDELDCPDGYDGRLRVGGPFVATLLDVAHPDALFYELGAPPRASFIIDDAMGEL